MNRELSSQRAHIIALIRLRSGIEELGAALDGVAVMLANDPLADKSDPPPHALLEAGHVPPPLERPRDREPTASFIEAHNNISSTSRHIELTFSFWMIASDVSRAAAAVWPSSPNTSRRRSRR